MKPKLIDTPFGKIEIYLDEENFNLWISVGEANSIQEFPSLIKHCENLFKTKYSAFDVYVNVTGSYPKLVEYCMKKDYEVEYIAFKVQSGSDENKI